MGQVLEFQGRLCRSDGREVASGRLDLRFRLHTDRELPAHVWEERHPGVRVATGGGYSVLLGQDEPLDAAMFDQPRFLGVYLERGDQLVEVGERVVLTGAALRMEAALRALEARLDAVKPPSPLSGEGADGAARRRIVKLHRRLKRLEQGGGTLADLAARLRELDRRLSRLDDEDQGRVVRLEDELEDVVGPDGDVIDLLERLEALERGHGGPMLLPKGDAELEARVVAGEGQVVLLGRQVEALRRALEVLTQKLATPPAPPAPPSTLPGPLNVLKGGIHVASGGLMVHEVEGRVAGASRREGPLLVNPRGGGDLLVGNKASGSVVATASLRAARVAEVNRALAIRVGGEGLEPGDVAALDLSHRAPSARRAEPGDTPLGVVVAHAGVELGEGPVIVAIAGVVRVRVEAPVAAGVALEAGAGGAARVGDGPAVGRTLGASFDGRVDVLVHAR